jgi:hypothetical protein
MNSGVFHSLASFSHKLWGRDFGYKVCPPWLALLFGTCTNHFLLKIIGNRTNFFLVHLVNSYRYTCHLEKDRHCLSHPIGLKRVGVNLCQWLHINSLRSVLKTITTIQGLENAEELAVSITPALLEVFMLLSHLALHFNAAIMLRASS